MPCGARISLDQNSLFFKSRIYREECKRKNRNFVEMRSEQMVLIFRWLHWINCVLLNIRGSDIAYNPVAIAFVVVAMKEI